MTELKIKVGDLVVYVPPYVTRYSEKYEGVVLSINYQTGKAVCKLGFGKKECRIEDLVLQKNHPIHQ